MRGRLYHVVALAVFAFCVFSSIATAEIKYVAKSGSDATGNGSSATPFLTICKGLSALKPGDILAIHAGTYEEGLNGIWPAGTSWSEAITVRSYPGEKVILRPGHEVSAIWIGEGDSYIILDGISIDGINLVTEYNCVGLFVTDDAHHIRIQNCEVKNSPRDGVIVADETSVVETVEFVNCSVHDNGSASTSYNDGILLTSSNALLDQCEFYRNACWGVQFYSDKIECGNNIIRNCTSRDNAVLGARGDGIGLFSGPGGDKAYNNAVWGNMNGIGLEHGCDNGMLYNNTICANTRDGINLGPGAMNAEVRNNILSDNGQYGLGLFT